MVELVGMTGAILLPFWNIPLILRIQQRRSSKDISLGWALGVFACLVAMLPAGLRSADPISRVFSVINLAFFTAVTVQVLRYR